MNLVFKRYYLLLFAILFSIIGFANSHLHYNFNVSDQVMDSGLNIKSTTYLLLDKYKCFDQLVYNKNYKTLIEKKHFELTVLEGEIEISESPVGNLNAAILPNLFYKSLARPTSSLFALKTKGLPLFTSFYSSLDALYIAFRVFRL